MQALLMISIILKKNTGYILSSTPVNVYDLGSEFLVYKKNQRGSNSTHILLINPMSNLDAENANYLYQKMIGEPSDKGLNQHRLPFL